MATTRQKTAARKNIKKARKVQSRRAHGERVPRRSVGLSTRQQNRMSTSTFAFTKQRKEPLNDARHVRNAITRFNQLERVTDKGLEAAWRRIRAPAGNYVVKVTTRRWSRPLRPSLPPR